jgi:diaminopimelate decarboxylase
VTKYRKFGIPPGSQEMARMMKLAEKSKRLKLRGVHFHAGPRMTERKPCSQNIHEASNAANDLLDAGFEINYLDVGAGFEPRLCGRTPRHLRRFEEYAKIVGGQVRKFAKQSRTPKLELICEPGTALVESSGLLLTKVKHLKPREGYNIAIVDAGLAILREARSDTPPIHPERDIAVVNRAKSTRKEHTMLGGPLCLSYDNYPTASTSEVRPRDLVAILDVGAYAQSMSQQFIDPRPKAVMISESGRVDTVLRAETFEHMLSLYKL